MNKLLQLLFISVVVKVNVALPCLIHKPCHKDTKALRINKIQTLKCTK